MPRRALIILPEAAYPVMGGGPLRTASMLEYLANRFVLDGLHFRLEGDPDPTLAYPAGMFARVAVHSLPRHSKALLPRILRNLLRSASGVSPLVQRFSGAEHSLEKLIQGYKYDLAWCEHFWTAPYAALLKRVAPRLVLDMHNIESDYFRSGARQAKVSEKWAWLRFARISERLEQQWLPQFDEVLATSQENAERLASLGAKRVHRIPNAIPNRPMPMVQKDFSIAFSGNFAYAPNLDGMEWFVNTVWPQLFLSFPELRLRVIGKEAELTSRLFTSLERVDIVGSVPDAVEEIAKSRVAVVPVRMGSGTRLKLLEAWAAGVPVVSTSLGAEGLGTRPGIHCEIADEPSLFQRKVSDLLQQEERNKAMAAAARQLLEESYTWSHVHNLLGELEL